jgi:16S rRNA (uracil1498-N3)-methyltransferase
MHCFYLAQKITGNYASISDAEHVHHLKDVLRLKIGEKVTIFDSEGSECLCEINGLDRKLVGLSVISRKEAKPSKFKLAIACALPKKSKMDDIIDKLTQIGTDSIIPLLTERVIVKLEEIKDARFERWEKIALSASEQSQRNRLPEVCPVTGFEDLLAESGRYDLKLIPTLDGERKSLREVIPTPAPANILVLIGPEGDFSPQEVQQAKDAGFIPISLGDNVLRVDTAAIAAASFIKLALDRK